MKIIKVKVDDLKLNDDNVRMHPIRQIEEYKRSLEMFGQTKNAVIDEDNNVLIGNGLVIAAKGLGWLEVAAIRRTDLSDNDKMKLMISDNKIYGLGVDNLDAIDKIFEKLTGDLNVPGYDEETLKNMFSSANEVTEELLKYGKLDGETITEIENRKGVVKHDTPTKSGIQETDEENPEQQENTEQTKNNEAESETADSVLFKCPKCGEDLWLSKELLRQLLC